MATNFEPIYGLSEDEVSIFLNHTIFKTQFMPPTILILYVYNFSKPDFCFF